MGSKKKTTTSQATTATTTPAGWATSGAEQNYANAQKYYDSGDGTWSADKAATYANPYQEVVQDRTVARMNTQGQVERAALNDTVQAAKAYGGTRGAILESEQAKNQSNGILDYLATSNAQGYNEARSAFEADRAAKMGQYSSLAGILATSPKTTTTTGTSNGTQVQSGSALDTILGLGQLGLSGYSAGLFG